MAERNRDGAGGAANVEALWARLPALAASSVDIRGLFAADPGRFERFSFRDGPLLLDLSKTALTAEALGVLLALFEATGAPALREAMFAGEPINLTEGRAVLHAALRAPAGAAFAPGGAAINAEVEAVRARFLGFADDVREGRVAAADGAPFTDVVNLGIGGSDLGPAMATLALAPFHDGPRVQYVSNVDGAHLHDTLAGLDPARTLFVVASKTFTTIETMTNAASARAWVAARLGEARVGAHFAAVSSAVDKARAFGIDESRVFGFWDWVGGRYSVWSAVGLPLAIAIGPENFRAFLDGAHALDRHFAEAPPERNLPVLLALAGLWHRHACGHRTRAILPYDQRLSRFPAFLQQLDMESNGKSVTRDGAPAPRPTGAVVWGEPGTNGQHAFFQLLHQGTEVVPAEFLLAANGHEPHLAHHHDLLAANALAQGEALLRGRTEGEAKAQLLAAGRGPEEAKRLAPHRVFPGNRPSLTLLYPRLDPETLGRLVALAEHRVFVEAAMLGINAFDQWGVELGKELATAMLPAVTGEGEAGASSAGLVAALRAMRGA